MAGKLLVPANRYGTQITVPYAEYISNKSWVGAGSAAHGPGMIQTHTFSTPWPNRYNFVKDALGWSQRNGARLQRKLPWQHPHNSNIRATRLTGWEGVHATGHSGGQTAGDATDYDICRLTFAFESLPYELREDGEIAMLSQNGSGGEWNRFVVRRGKPSAEFLSRDGFTWKYTEGPAGITGNEFPGRAGYPLTRYRFQWVWVQVPGDYLLDSNEQPTNLLQRVNTINNATFAGQAAQTLLFEDFELEPRMDPINPNQMAIPRTFDVVLHMTYFSPSSMNVLGGATDGWNNDPGPDWKWYNTHAFVNGVDSGRSKFQTSDFTKLFAPVGVGEGIVAGVFVAGMIGAALGQ